MKTYLYCILFSLFLLFLFYCKAPNSTCWALQLTQLWSCPRTRQPCTILTAPLETSCPQTDSELQSASDTLSQPIFIWLCVHHFNFFSFSFLGVHPSWASSCRHRDAITGRPSSLEARRTGWGWPAARPTETAQWGRTTCHGVCSVCQHHQGMCVKKLATPTFHWNPRQRLPSFVSTAAGTSCCTETFAPACLWPRYLRGWELSSTTSAVVLLFTMPKAVSCWAPLARFSQSHATRSWPWRWRAAWQSAWCRRCQSLPETDSSAVPAF